MVDSVAQVFSVPTDSPSPCSSNYSKRKETADVSSVTVGVSRPVSTSCIFKLCCWGTDIQDFGVLLVT